MAEVKISDLSIGDWVLCDGEDWKISAINEESVGLRVDSDYSVASLEECDPIPLTPEILKKNGWECIAVGDNGPATPKEHYNRYEKWRCESKWGYRDLFFDRMTKKWRLSGMNCTTFTTVHKLQHALRFSGFEKEIVV